ncbi:uncharacterized protein N7473_002687 [Penicillium subrubescens]|uniref:uncharacterized protein n=1 Tax=Penicillium subrubescens TaxID=1316194 RepID=UPI002545555F|nr:uncharacterized protein N7473_002687 [Penicillium subrubescens]KAJ5905771.1 hypothetical protein N7473_002687 [Penicillium subrubescens]
MTPILPSRPLGVDEPGDNLAVIRGEEFLLIRHFNCLGSAWCEEFAPTMASLRNCMGSFLNSPVL